MDRIARAGPEFLCYHSAVLHDIDLCNRILRMEESGSLTKMSSLKAFSRLSVDPVTALGSCPQLFQMQIG
jgi:hypothetical protein